MSSPPKSGALANLYKRQQPKVNATPRKAALLKHFAEDDYKRIAKLIQLWLEQDESKKVR